MGALSVVLVDPDKGGDGQSILFIVPTVVELRRSSHRQTVVVLARIQWIIEEATQLQFERTAQLGNLLRQAIAAGGDQGRDAASRLVSVVA